VSGRAIEGLATLTGEVTFDSEYSNGILLITFIFT
jgi:hypothetical protein